MPLPPWLRRSFALLALTAAGCQPPTRPAEPAAVLPTPAAPVTTRPTTAASAPPLPAAPRLFAAAGIRFSYPADWAPRPLPSAGSAKLQAAAADGSAVLTLDVPSLPPHIPGLIPVGLVAGGYVDDVKKRLPDATGPAPAAVTVPAAAARRVSLAGHDAAGRAATDDSVLIVHGDHVYVLSVDATPATRPAAAAVLDAAVASIRWPD